MIATLLFAAVTAAAPAPADDIKTLCPATKGHVPALTPATATQAAPAQRPLAPTFAPTFAPTSGA